MPEQKQDVLDQRLQLQELAPNPEDQLGAGTSPLEDRMRQAVDDLESLPTAAQLAVLRAFVPELLESLEITDRLYWARELLGEGVPEIPTLTV